MATKRLKALLRRDDGGMAHFPAWTVVSWPAEPKDRNETTPVITFVERLSGDVVLSREDGEEVGRVLRLSRTSFANEEGGREMVAAIDKALALLRGRR